MATELERLLVSHRIPREEILSIRAAINGADDPKAAAIALLQGAPAAEAAAAVSLSPAAKVVLCDYYLQPGPAAAKVSAPALAGEGAAQVSNEGAHAEAAAARSDRVDALGQQTEPEPQPDSDPDPEPEPDPERIPAGIWGDGTPTISRPEPEPEGAGAMTPMTPREEGAGAASALAATPAAAAPPAAAGSGSASSTLKYMEHIEEMKGVAGAYDGMKGMEGAYDESAFQIDPTNEFIASPALDHLTKRLMSTTPIAIAKAFFMLGGGTGPRVPWGDPQLAAGIAAQGQFHVSPLRNHSWTNQAPECLWISFDRLLVMAVAARVG